MKVYVLTNGEYSDFHNIGVFTDKVLAEKVKKYGSIANEIEEYELDQMDEFSFAKNGLYIYYISMFKNGDIVSNHGDFGISLFDIDSFVYVGIVNINAFEYPHFHVNEKLPAIPNQYERKGELVMTTYVMARNKKHAIKIANEKRTCLIANNLFHDGYKFDPRVINEKR